METDETEVQDTSCRGAWGCPPSFKTSPKIGGYRGLIQSISAVPDNKRPTRKRCRVLPAGGLGVSPNFKKSPKIGGYRGLIQSISAVS